MSYFLVNSVLYANPSSSQPNSPKEQPGSNNADDHDMPNENMPDTKRKPGESVEKQDLNFLKDVAARNPLVEAMISGVLQTSGSDSSPATDAAALNLTASDLTKENLEEARYTFRLLFDHFAPSIRDRDDRKPEETSAMKLSEVERSLSDTLGQMSVLRKSLGLVEHQREDLNSELHRTDELYEEVKIRLADAEDEIAQLRMKVLDDATQAASQDSYVGHLEKDLWGSIAECNELKSVSLGIGSK